MLVEDLKDEKIKFHLEHLQNQVNFKFEYILKILIVNINQL